MQKVKVAVDIRDLRIAKTGVKTYLEELVKEFMKLDSPDMSFVFLDTDFPVYTGKNKFFKIIEHFRFFTWKQIVLPIKARLNGCNVIFCADFFVPYFTIKATTIPVLHDAFFFEYPNHYNRIWLWLFRNIGIPAAKKSSKIITPTQYTALKIAEFTGISQSKLAVVYEGPKTMLSASLARETEILGKLHGEKYILHVGVIEKRKNLLNLLKAYQLLQPKHPELKLVLVGQFSPKTDMDDKHQILEFIANNNLEHTVILAGYVPDAEISVWYKNATAYVFPSYNEGFGIPVLEAFSNNLPVLIANNSCLPEVAGDAAVQFDPHDPTAIAESIHQVLMDENLRKEMIIKGVERVKLFTWQKTAAQLVRIFAASVEKKS